MAQVKNLVVLKIKRCDGSGASVSARFGLSVR